MNQPPLIRVKDGQLYRQSPKRPWLMALAMLGLVVFCFALVAVSVMGVFGYNPLALTLAITGMLGAPICFTRFVGLTVDKFEREEASWTKLKASGQPTPRRAHDRYSGRIKTS